MTDKVYSDEREAILWHAFDTLDDRRLNQVPKSKLKVLSHNVGTVYGINGLEVKLDDVTTNDEQRQSLTFEEYSSFLKEHLSETQTTKDGTLQADSKLLTPSSSPSPGRKRSSSNVSFVPNKFNEICWMLCGKLFLSREDEAINEKSVKILWEIFSFLAERDDDNKLVIPVCVDIEEVEFLCQNYLELTGQVVRTIEQMTVADNLTAVFSSFLLTFATNCVNGMSAAEVEVGVADLHEMIINDSLKKGVLVKKGNVKALSQWKERLFILTPKRLTYYTVAKMECKGEIKILPEHTVQGIADRPGTKTNRLTYTTEGRVYEMSASDLRTKNQWISVIRAAIEHCASSTSYQRDACDKRRAKRQEKRRKKREEELLKIEENERIQRQIADIEAEKEARGEAMVRLRQEAEEKDAEQCRLHEVANEKKKELENERLSREAAELRMQSEAEQKLRDLESKMTSDIELEKQAREEAENKLSMEEALRLAEEERLKDLQEMNERLQALLLEEQEARKDEEIVRCLQARILDEELEKREALEKVQQEMSDEFEAEKQRSEGLAQEKTRTDEELAQAMAQQQQLEQERVDAQLKIEEAMKKLQDAERKRVELESQIRKKAAPIGLARPIQVEARPLLTHRGEGAFPKAYVTPSTPPPPTSPEPPPPISPKPLPPTSHEQPTHTSTETTLSDI